MGDQFWLTEEQVERLRPHCPKVRGKARSDDRMVLSGIVHVKRNGLRWRDAPAVYGPHKTRLTIASCAGRGWGSSRGSSETWLDLGPRATRS